jgi:hypothetical protein
LTGLTAHDAAQKQLLRVARFKAKLNFNSLCAREIFSPAPRFTDLLSAA